MRLKRLMSGVSAGILSVSSLFVMAPTLVSAAVNTCTWTGTAGDSKFSTAGNWSGCNSTAPQNGDTLAFNNTGNSSKQVLTQDINGLSVDTITSTGTSDNTFEIDGNLTVTNAITVTGAAGLASNQIKFNGVITFGGDVTIGGTAGSVSAGTSLQVVLAGHNLNVNVPFYPTKITGDGTNNGGTITVGNGGSLALGNGTSTGYATAGYWSGSLVVANGGNLRRYPDSDLNPASSITINDGGQLSLCNGGSAPQQYNGANVANPLTVGGKGQYSEYGQTYSGAIYVGACGMGGSASSFVPEYSVNWTGPVSLTSDVGVSGTGEFKVSGSLSGAHTITMMAGSVGRVTVASTDNSSQTPNGTQGAERVETTLSDDSPTTSIGVDGNTTLTLDGTRAQAYVATGGILKGTGTLNELDVQDGGAVAPGHSPGKLTVLQTLTLESGSIYEAELKTAKAGEYDQLQVSDPSRTTGNDVNVTDAILNVSLYDGYSIKKGDTFTIIDNKQPATQAVTGTFKDLPEGATFAVGSASFSISYKGGDGNDVVLTALTDAIAPAKPDTGFAFIGSNPIVSVAVAALAAGAIILLVKKQTRVGAKVASKSKRR